MRYALIGTDGTYLVPNSANPGWDDLGTTEPTRVPLDELPDGLGPVAGWVNGAGAPTYPVNTIGGQVLVAMGAANQSYFGPVVITGWDPVNEVATGLHSDQAWIVQQHAEAQGGVSPSP